MEDIKLILKDKGKAEEARELLKGFHLTAEDARKITETFEREMELGMEGGLSASSLQMENTFVPELLIGEEENGCYLALDLGGTNFRVMLLAFDKGRVDKEEVSYYSVPEATRLGPGVALFDFLADCIADFMEKQKALIDPQKTLPLGFTFSFPMTQTSLDSGLLVTWTKSFNCSGVVGTDAVEHLNAAMRRHKLNVRVVAILNDTTGTLVKGTYDRADTAIGLILGTGMNGAYLERADRVKRWGVAQNKPEEVVVDLEMGAFGDNGCIDFIKTDIDRALDRDSLLPRSFTFEKYFAGKYIGELARLIFLTLHQRGLLFKGRELGKLKEKNSFETSDVSDVEEDTLAGSNKRCVSIFNRLCLTLDDDDEDDVALIRHVCAVLTHRGALLVALTLASLLRRMDKHPQASIAVTGSLYKYHPRFKQLLEAYVEKFCQGKRFETFLSDDGSGKGAALVAAIAMRTSVISPTTSQ